MRVGKCIHLRPILLEIEREKKLGKLKAAVNVEVPLALADNRKTVVKAGHRRSWITIKDTIE